MSWKSVQACICYVAVAGYTQSVAAVPRDPSPAPEGALSSRPVNKVDLLFVIDNSNSMAGEQAALRAQIPHLVETLTTGMRHPGDPNPFRAVTDLHVGVVSTDMGIPGVEFGSCHADGGDDGRLQHAGSAEPGLSCADEYPAYLTYSRRSDPQELAADAQCIASLGTGGCGIEQPLEAAFKALWPKEYRDASGGVVKQNPYRFISTTEAGTWGRGDQPLDQDGNLGFLRNDPDDPSLIAVVLLTDEEDCSVSRTDHLKPNNQLSEDSPYRTEDINLRCYYHPEFEYDIRARYLAGLRKLRPGREDLVVFTAIAGVPADLVAPDVLAAVDFSDAVVRDSYYDFILGDPRMQETVDPSTNPGSGQGNLKPSCVRSVPGESAPSTAYPPRRLVQLAKLFGENGRVQSICQDDFGPALEPIVTLVSKSLGSAR